MIKGVFIDFFDVIAPGALTNWVEREGLSISEELLKISARSDIGDIDGESYFKEAAEILGVDYDNLLRDITQNEAINQDVVSLIDTLGENYQVVLITNSSSDYLRHMLERFDLERRFDHILVSAEIGMTKPNLDIFQTALEVAGLSPEEAVFIDDRKENVDGAKALGIHGIVFEDVETLKYCLEELGVL